MNNIIIILTWLIVTTITGCATNVPVSVRPVNVPQPVMRHELMPQRPVNTFIWPVRGEVISPFGAGEGGVRNKGIDIKASEGTIVRAAGAGRVVYSDQYLKGFGRTVIIDHGGGFETVYAYNSAIIAKVGTVVGQNDIIAKVGSTGRARIPSLHFEIRKDGKPVNPAYYLRLPNNGN